MMASACVNNAALAPDSPFLDFAPACPGYGWLSPRISFSRDLADGGAAPSGLDVGDSDLGALVSSAAVVTERPDPNEPGVDLPDFEFRPDDPVTMLPADELFSDGKLVPLQIAAKRHQAEPADGIRSPEAERPRRVAEVLGLESCAQSPKAPRCSSRWRELLGFKTQQNPKPEAQKAATLTSKSVNHNTRSLRHLLHRLSKHSAADASLAIPLLRESDLEPVSISSRRSLSSSSSSSGADHDELPRLSLDAEKPAQRSISLSRVPHRARLARPRVATAEGHQAARTGRSPPRRGAELAPPRGASVDSPRMNASGKVVFQGLERSSSSPGSFHGRSTWHHHHQHRGKPYRAIERSYSANVRVAPVLNVLPVGSLRICTSKPGSVFGLAQLFSPHKKDRDASTARWNLHSGGNRSKIIDKEKARREST
ncbi:unnamed protein product [Musa acuminata subsp. malaccensis]|uniref:(wild Malaysian banana) hypothetical protein n=3 Tax=Musa acuminata TaxID=4641 RepID=A0A804JN36_MUSAM|nr:unnamed protein product [Musa acuminata subsp. malaccensis]